MDEGLNNSRIACARFSAELADHLEGDSRPFVLAHSRECPACGNLIADLHWVQSQARNLPQEDPAPQVWNGIQKRLVAERESAAACARFSLEIEKYLEGDAPPFVVSHAHECAACNALLADLQAIQVAARDLPQEEPAPTVWAKVSENLRAEGALISSPCAQFSHELEAFLEGEDRSFVPTHARECSDCDALLNDLQGIQVAARDLLESEPSLALWGKIRSSLVEEGVLVPSLCAHFSTELETQLDGEASSFVTAHARECDGCGALLADMELIRAAARDLPQEEPSRAVWANVRAQLDAEGVFAAPEAGWRRLLRFLPQPVPLGVLASVTVIAAFLIMPAHEISSWSGLQEAKTNTTTTQVATLTLPPEDMPVAHVVSDLEGSFRQNEGSMAPDLKATYEKSLVSLDSSIQECLDSLRQEPGNTLAHDYLLTAYSRKAEVLSSALEFEGR